MKFSGKYIAFLVCLLQVFAIAQSYASDVQNIQIGNVNFAPKISVTQGYTDNLLQSDTTEINTWYTIITPSFTLNRHYKLNDYQLTYSFSNKSYSSESSDSFTNHNLAGNAQFEFDIRHHLKLNGSYALNYEERGRGFSIGFGEVLKEPTKNETTAINSTYTYGSKTARANVDVNLGFAKVRWESLFIDDLNTPQIETDLDYTANREYDSTTLGGAFKYDIGGFTKVVFNTALTNVEYLHPRAIEGSLDSKATAAFVGIEWQGSALTTGYAKIGYSNKNFDANNRSDTSGFRWQLGILYKPLTYSNFDLSSSKSVDETKGQGSYIENTNYALSWHHQWLNRIATKMTYQLSNDEYGDTDREDDNNTYSASISYQMRKNLNFVVAASQTERSSNYSQVEFKENTLQLSVNASL